MKKKNKNIVRYTVNKEFKRNSKDPPPKKNDHYQLHGNN